MCRINWFMFGCKEMPEVAEAPKAVRRLTAEDLTEICWEETKGADEYDIRISDGEKVRIISNVTAPFCETELKPEKCYEISVRTKNNAGYSEWSQAVIN